MNHVKRILGIFIVFVFLPATYGASQQVTVEIDYGGLQQSRKVEIPWKQGITALEALQSVAKIKTQKHGEHFLVLSIDNTVMEIGNRAWYYNINGKRATSFVNRCILSEGDSMRWEYTKDVCTHNKEEQK